MRANANILNGTQVNPMTPEEIQALVAKSVGEALAAQTDTIKTTIMSDVDKANSGLAASLSRQIKGLSESLNNSRKAEKPVAESKSEGDSANGKDKSKETAPTNEPDLRYKALQTQLESLRKENEERAAREFSNASSAALSAAIADSGAQNVPALRKVLTVDFGQKLKQEGGLWFVDDGLSTVPLTDAVKTYLTTDEGKHFVPAAPTKGSGATEAKAAPVVVTDATGKVSPALAVAAAFADI